MKKYPIHKILLNLLLALAFPVIGGAQSEGVNTVVIDAGHGGKDPGNPGTGRYKNAEKDIALAVALKVGSYIEENLPDVKVLYTRKTDKFVDLKERADIANQADADLFISIHCDAFNSSSVMGATSLVMGRNHDDDNLRVAMQENSVITMEEDYEEKYEGFDPNKPESYIAFTLYQSAFINQSINFAQKVQDQFRERVSRRDRGVKQQPLMVTKMAVMPAVLIELGFLTNAAEEDFLNSENGQAYMASAIYRAFREYKEERDKLEIQKSPAPLASAETTEDRKPQSLSASASQNPEGLENTEPAPAIFYSVQITTSIHKRDLAAENFKGVQGVECYKDGGMYKYIVGQIPDLESANALKLKMRESGFRDAFVIALADGERISIAEARRLLE